MSISGMAGRRRQRTLRTLVVLAGDDFMASDLVRTAQLQGIHVPEQMAVLGANNDDLRCAVVAPLLSSVIIPWEQIGYEAARCLDRMMQGQELPQKVVTRVAPTGVAQRGSTQILGARQLSLKRVAYEMGFASPAELCRFSRRVLGHSPGDLRGEESLVAIRRACMEFRE